MTDDGQARVIDRTVPSPPRSQPIPNSFANVGGFTPINGPASLRRSYSAAGLHDRPRENDTPVSAKVARISTAGRSRDSRTWTFWCDSEARNSLAHTAERESEGSAANAIGLIRQNSRTALRKIPVVVNTAMTGENSPAGVKALNAKPERKGLMRAKTTYGRLQGKKGVWEDGGDEDKENWDPQGGGRRAPPPSVGRERTVLGENAQVGSYAQSLGGMLEQEKKEKRRSHGGEEIAVDSEVAKFMGEDANADWEAPVADELDCVKSLLSLSKGNWR